jgi:apolipoprotein N-acyltransferase
VSPPACFIFTDNKKLLNKIQQLGLAFASAVLAFAAWPVSPATMLIFIAWVPLLWLESVVESRKQFFLLTYLTMFIWNVATTWWIWNASVPGALAAFVANSLLMCLPWLGFKIARKWLGNTWGYISLIAFWMLFEFIHLQDWGLSWPWLTLGNVFATQPNWIQWYEYTGTSGGTLWVLAVNILLFLHLRENIFRASTKKYKYLLLAVPVIILPPIISIGVKYNAVENVATNNVVIVQPNIDPYEKISSASIDQQLNKLITLSEKKVDENTTLLVWPETALYTETGIEEGRMKENAALSPLWSFLQQHPHLQLFTGVESFRTFETKQSSSSKATANPGVFYDAFNGSVLLDSSGERATYHKSMLVPGVETLPWFLRFIDKWFAKFGGTTAGYARQKDRTPLRTSSGYIVAPSICYESIYGEFMSRYVKHGANIICIITNDGWWENTPGHKQHEVYARLRAIENRVWIARSANTGISCFISPSGQIFQPQGWDTEASIKMNIPAIEKRPSFYTRYGDLISRFMMVLAIGLFAWTIILKIKSKLNRRGQNIGL